MNPRITRLAEKLPELSAEGIWITDETNVTYLTGFTGDSSSLLVTANGATMLSDGRYKEQLADECPGLNVAIKSPLQSQTDFFVEVLQSAVTDLAFEADTMTVSALDGLKKALPKTNWIPTGGIVLYQRSIKDEQEIAILRRAVDINQRALQSVLAKLVPNWTEAEMALELEATIRHLGASGFSFDPIIGAGPGGAKPHYSVGDIRLGDHACLLVDWGTKYQGYASDLTRCFHFGQPPARFNEAYQAVLDAQMAAIEAIRPGAKCSDIDAAARKVLQQAGLGDYFVHGLGHGVGLQIHESPRLSVVSEDILQVGQVITVEPGVYFEGDFGIRIEDDVLVTESGYQVLSTMPKGLDDCAVIL